MRTVIIIYHYIEFVDFNMDKKKRLQYFRYLKDNYSVSYYRKQVNQILMFLNYLDVEFTKEIHLPAAVYYPKHISKDDVVGALK